MKTDPIEVNIISPNQVLPGAVMKIRVSLINIQEITSIQVRSMNISEKTRDLNISIKEDKKKVTINDISYENPFQVTGKKTISKKASIQKGERRIVNKKLPPAGNAIKLMKELKKEFDNKIETEKRSVKHIRSYLKLEKRLKKIIDNGRNSIVLEVPIPKDFPEGVTVKIPINISYSTESSSNQKFSAFASVTVTSNPVPKRAIIIDIDGLKRDALYNSLHNMPNMQVIVNNGIKFTDAKTVFPSITLAAQASLFTGNYPGQHKITGNEWFDKSSLTYHKYSADVWYEDIIWNEGKANEDLGTNVKTIYEAAKNDRNMDSTVIFNQYSRLNGQTTRWIPPGAEEFLHNELTHEYEKVDSDAMSEALEDITYLSLPGIMTIYLPGLDGYSHFYGPGGDDPHNQEYYLKNYVDKQIGRLINGDCVLGTLRRCAIHFDGLIGEGLMDETIIIIVADHGLTSVVDDNRHAISRDELEVILKNSGYDIKDKLLESDYDAIAAPNGGMAHIYIRDIDTKDWNDQPKLSDLRRALDAFYSHTYVDRILIKYSGSGGYRVYTGSGKTKDLQIFFKGNANYVDAVDRIRGLDSTRSGDIILLAKDGWYFADSKFYGEHGGLSQAESYIPLIFSGPTIRKGATDSTPARIIDIAKTLADLLGFSMPDADGSILPVKEQDVK